MKRGQAGEALSSHTISCAELTVENRARLMAPQDEEQAEPNGTSSFLFSRQSHASAWPRPRGAGWSPSPFPRIIPDLKFIINISCDINFINKMFHQDRDRGWRGRKREGRRGGSPHGSLEITSLPLTVIQQASPFPTSSLSSKTLSVSSCPLCPVASSPTPPRRSSPSARRGRRSFPARRCFMLAAAEGDIRLFQAIERDFLFVCSFAPLFDPFQTSPISSLLTRSLPVSPFLLASTNCSRWTSCAMF